MTNPGTTALPALDWGRLSPLRLRAREVAEGVYAGSHASFRRGSGVEFAGHRNYVPGDDLRFLDRRAMARHGKLLVREFETETDRGLRLLVDATRSMAYRSEYAPGAKLAYAALIAAALARIAVSTGSDTVSVDFIGGDETRALAPMGGVQAFERAVETLEAVVPSGDALATPALLDRAVEQVARRTKRGTIVVVLSDFLDLPDGAEERVAALAPNGRVLVCVRVLDPAEARFPFQGPIHLHSSEGTARVETDGGGARAGYLEALAKRTTRLRETLVSRSGRLVETETTDEPVGVVQRIVQAAVRSS